jgi:hypothetical protein
VPTEKTAYFACSVALGLDFVTRNLRRLAIKSSWKKGLLRKQNKRNKINNRTGKENILPGPQMG